MKTIPIDMFQVEIYVAFSCDDYQTILEKLGIRDDEAERDWDSSGGFVWAPTVNGSMRHIVAFPSVSPLVIFHESIHLCHSIMVASNIPVTEDNTEIQAYLASHIAGKLIAMIGD